MKSKGLVVVGLVVVFAAAMVAAQTGGAQASGAASNQTSVSAGRSGAEVDSQTSAQASGSVSHEDKSGKAEASGSNSGSAAASKGNAQLAGGSTINAVLSKPVDVKKNKPGDEVTAKVEQNVKASASGSSQVVIPKGSRLVGHVTEAKRRDKDHASKKKGEAGASASGQADSALGIVFDKAILKNGQEIPLHAVIQAVGAAQQNVAANAMPPDLTASGSSMGSASGSASGGRSGGGVLGSVGSTVGATTGAAGNTTAEVGKTVGGAVETTTSTAGSVTSGVGGATTATGQLTSSASGVVGLQGLNLSSAAAGSTQGSLITSSTRDVRLDSGTQMVLRVVGSAQ